MSDRTNQLSASVVIPSSGRADTLEMTLDALCGQTVPATEFEVIVVDDGASPPLALRLQGYRDRLVLRSIRLERAGPSAARNAGARLASSPLLIFLDDDCVPVPGWLQAWRTAALDAPAAALAGPIVNGLPDNGLPDNLSSEAYHLIFGYLYSRHIESRGVATSAPFVISANFAVPAALFAGVGGFDERFRVAGEDRMFSEQWLRRGYELRAVPAAVVRHHRPLTLVRFVAQQYRYGRGGAILRKELRAQGGRGKPLEDAAFYAKLLLTAFRHPKRGQRVPLFVLLGLSQAAIAAGHAVEWFRPGLPPSHVD